MRVKIIIKKKKKGSGSHQQAKMEDRNGKFFFFGSSTWEVDEEEYKNKKYFWQKKDKKTNSVSWRNRKRIGDLGDERQKEPLVKKLRWLSWCGGVYPEREVCRMRREGREIWSKKCHMFFRAFLFTLEYIVIECIGIHDETSSTLGLLKKWSVNDMRWGVKDTR